MDLSDSTIRGRHQSSVFASTLGEPSTMTILRVAVARLLCTIGLVDHVPTIPTPKEMKLRRPLFDSVEHLKVELARLQADE